MEIEQKVWGMTPDAEPIVLYTMTNSKGESIALSSLGAGVVAINVKDRNGVIDDVALGYGEAMSYMGDGPCMGKTPGRFANRIAKGSFTLNGKEYQLAVNNGPNHLHGGPKGFCNRVWEGRVETNRVIFSLHSADGDENYPGALYVEVVYDWNDQSEMEVTLLARGDSDTIVNLTNHTYLNLAGHNSGSVLDEELQLFASRYLPSDETLIPTGSFDRVEGTPMDFTSPKRIGTDIKEDFPALKNGKGYDNSYIIDNWEAGKMNRACRLHDPKSGRTLEMSTTQQIVHIYTGNWLAGSPLNKAGRNYNDYDGIAIECQAMPDAPNQPNFPSVVLKAGELYEHHIVWKFSAE